MYRTQASLNLDRSEVILLTDRTLNADVGTEGKCFDTYNLLLKLGSAYLELTERDVPHLTVELVVTEAEAWHLRGKVSSSDKTASNPLFGVQLLRKLYSVLLVMNADVPIRAAVDVPEQAGWEVQQAISKWKEGEKDVDTEPDPG